MTTVLAISWEPEIRGLLTVVIAVLVFCGSVYLVLGTNLGARLGFLVSFAALAGWMALMGAVWMMYGLGLQGRAPSWEPVAGRAVIQDNDALVQAGVLDQLPDVEFGVAPVAASNAIAEEFVSEDWIALDESDGSFGQASSTAGELLEETEVFAADEYQAVRVFDSGGDRYPKINDTIDFVAFWSTPHYAVVEVAPLEPVRVEEGRAPATPQIDEEGQRRYVYMVRDLGTQRQPAAVIMIGSTLVLLASAWLLHRRETLVARNRAVAAG